MVGTSVARARAQDQVEGSVQGTAWDVVPPSLAVLKERRCAAAEYFSAAYDTPPLELSSQGFQPQAFLACSGSFPRSHSSLSTLAV